MRAVIASAVLLVGCYRENAVTPCTLTCNDSPCPSGLVCGSDFICQSPGMPLCSTIDSGVDGDGSMPSSIFVKAPNADPNDLFGASIALSADGAWLAVGAPGESSAAANINGTQNDNSMAASGAVYIYQWDSNAETYAFRTYVKSQSPDPNDRFGTSVSLSANGNILAVGVPHEDGGGINNTGDPTDDTVFDTGCVFIYERASAGSPWMLTRYIKPPAAVAQGLFGQSVALSDDGAFVAIGQPGNESTFRINLSSFTGYGGPPTGVFAGDGNGMSVEIAGDGLTQFGGAAYEDNGGSGFTGDPGVGGAVDSGAVFIETQNGAQNRFCKASNTGTLDHFGTGLASDRTAGVFAVGAPGEDSNAGIDGDQLNNAAMEAGAVYIFGRTGAASWMQSTYLKAPNATGENFGASLALTDNGDFLVVGAPGASTRSGAVYTFQRMNGTWMPVARVTAFNGEGDDEFGASVAISFVDGVLATGAPHESSTSSADPNDNASPKAGAVYVFR